MKKKTTHLFETMDGVCVDDPPDAHHHPLIGGMQHFDNLTLASRSSCCRLAVRMVAGVGDSIENGVRRAPQRSAADEPQGFSGRDGPGQDGRGDMRRRAITHPRRRRRSSPADERSHKLRRFSSSFLTTVHSGGTPETCSSVRPIEPPSSSRSTDDSPKSSHCNSSQNKITADAVDTIDEAMADQQVPRPSRRLGGRLGAHVQGACSHRSGAAAAAPRLAWPW